MFQKKPLQDCPKLILPWFNGTVVNNGSDKVENLTKCIRAFLSHGHLLTVSMLSSDLFSRPVLLETQLLEKPFRPVSQFGVKQTYPPSAVSSFYSLVKRNYVAQSQRCHCEQAWLSTAQSLFIIFFCLGFSFFSLANSESRILALSFTIPSWHLPSQTYFHPFPSPFFFSSAEQIYSFSKYIRPFLLCSFSPLCKCLKFFTNFLLYIFKN